MLQTLRNNTRTILWIVVASFVIFIILVWGADLQVGGQSAAQGVVGSVNGRQIPYQLYQRQVAATLQNLRAQGQRTTTLEEEREATQQTWKSLVDELLIAEAAGKRPLPVTDGEVVFWVKSSPPPQLTQNPAFIDSTTGRFDQARYEELLRTSPEQFRWYEDFTRVQIPIDKLQRNVLASAKVSQGEVDAYVRDRYEQLRMSYLWVDPRRFPDSGAPTEAEAKAYYDSHQDEFQAKERVQLLIARIPKVPSPADEAAANEEMQGYASTVQRGEASFGSLAESFSEDPFAAAGGDRGRALRRQEVEPGLVERVFSAPAHELVGPIRIDDRLLLLQVTGDSLIEGERARRFATIERRIEPGPDRLTELRERVTGLAKAAGGRGLATAAAMDSVRVDTTGTIERGSFTPLLTGARDVLDLAFEMSKGQVSKPIEAEREILLVQLLDRRPAGALTFEEVKARAERGAARLRQLELARPKAEAMANAVRTSGSLAAAAAAESLVVKDSGRFTRKGSIPEVGRDPELIASVFTQPVGSTSGLIETDKGFFIARPDSIFPPPAADLERYVTSARQVLLNERRNQTYEAWLADLRDHAKIQDHRERFN